MGLFSKKKDKKEETQGVPPLKFPELPQEEFPSYEPAQGIAPQEMNTIKEAVQPSLAEPMPAPMEEPMHPPMHQTMMPAMGMEQPLFVRIEKYKDAINTINHLKDKLDDADKLLDELNRIKEQEERELHSWHKDLQDIKQKLMLVDQKLFEK